MKRIMCLLLLICLAIPAFGFAEKHEYVGRMMVVNCKRDVSLRAEPSKNSSRLEWVDYHTVLENCWSGYGDFYYVEYYGTAGYIHKDYLEVYDGPEEIYYGEYYEEMQIVGCPGWTPLREMADVNSKQLAKVPLGAVVYDCEYYADDFTYVNYNGIGGYVLTEYITLGSGNVAEADLSVKYVTNCQEKVSLRAEPDSKSERLAWVPKGAAVDAVDAVDGYFYVRYGSLYGYISGDYLAYIGYIGYSAEDMIVVNCVRAPMYKMPVPEFGQQMWVPNGAKVESCYSAHDGYFYVMYDDVSGYIHGDYLEVDLGDAEALGSMQVFDCDEYDDGVWLRSSANELSTGFRKVPLGAIVNNCYAYNDEYVYGEYDGQYGFLYAKYLIEDLMGAEQESYDAMQIVNCGGVAYLYEHTGYDPEIVAAVPLGGILTDCVRVDERFFYGSYNGLYGFIDGYYLEAVEGPYADSDDILSNTRTKLNSLNVGLGVYLISDSMGGDWSILQEKNHLENVLSGMPEEWWPLTMAIPDDRIIEIIGGRNLFLIIPTDEFASVTVNRLRDFDGDIGIVDEVLYESATGEPFLLRCNVDEFVLDNEIVIAETDGDVYSWCLEVLPDGIVFDPQVGCPEYCDLTVYEE